MPRKIPNGCLIPVAVLLALIVIALGFVLIQAQLTPKGRPDYVALGSSYAAGAGLGQLQKDSPLLCARSVNGYPQQLARLRHLSIVDMSCGGAVTPHLLRGGQAFQGPQIRVIGPDTRLVTITVGGNDIGYVGDLSLLAMRHDTSFSGWLARTFWKGPKTQDQRGFAKLHDDLLATLREIHTRAPRATVIVATYPTVLPPAGTCARLGLTTAEADTMRETAKRLSDTTRAAAAEGGAMVVDMNVLGGGHDVCAVTPWMNGWKDVHGAMFHPNLAGAQATAAAVSQALH